ncbi:heparinase II/III family protein [Formosa sp. PL04]|uniref:heparinase II/III family protein n=1 Tax=Formosa sp. PL04 TaxID=3081755 RepID=UPI002981C9B4|nr:heparinase II/III family protein [Formosa sp. PL04]MDW5289901.1 heparinase II/III family protein [Formosa sp. PL04]
MIERSSTSTSSHFFNINHLYKFSFSILFLTVFSTTLWAQEIPSQKVLTVTELPNYLKPEVREQLEVDGKITEARLAAYFREQFSKRFYYDYKTFPERLKIYNDTYNNASSHKERALDHLNKFPDFTDWELPFNYLKGGPVDAYALRHLARQHKMVDIAMLYFNDGKDPKYIRYFVEQMRSLNFALESENFETIEDGNGVYEVYRAGYRVTNWLWIHNMFLSDKAYTDADQLQTIATLLQTGAHLYKNNSKFSPGNHQTKGMSALAAISILLHDFEGTDNWYDRAMLRLSEHLDKEINADGFQFERSVHYHMDDINNYLYTYQLIKINDIEVDQAWEDKLKSLFTTLPKIAYPDKSAPVLQDDTRKPWAESNDISGALTLGYLLYNDPSFGYFATNKVDASMYWFLSNAQVEQLNHIEKKRPEYGSLAFEDTEYYIMRQGWDADDDMMIISNGVDADKPDHQHGDVLGIQAMANGHIILPNYQVRYSLEDLDVFKNSMVKNVALVDNELQGKAWTSNKGGSGFGKFKNLPTPKTIAWNTNTEYDLFVGTHDGFENIGVNYSRQVIYVKDKFWIVKDNFKSDKTHDYKQVWQGHYTSELSSDLIRASFPDAVGSDIFQLNATDTAEISGANGKNWTVITKENQQNFDFLTVILPYKGYNNGIDQTLEDIVLKNWKVITFPWGAHGDDTTVLAVNGACFAFGIKEMSLKGVTLDTSVETDLYLSEKDGKFRVSALGDQDITVTLNKNSNLKISLKPGETHIFNLN